MITKSKNTHCVHLVNFLICLFLLCTSGIVQFTFIWNKQSIILLFVFSVTLFCLLTKGKFKISKLKTYKFLIFALIVVINVGIYSENIDGHIALLLILASCFLLVHFIDFELLSQYYVWMMLVISIISLICFTLFVLNPQAIMNRVPLIQYWSVESRCAIIYNFPGDQYTFRNFGPYHEGGMFAVFVNLAILFFIEEYDFKCIKNKLILAVFIITVLTTLSTTGILLMGSIFILKLLPKIYRKSPGKMLVVLIVITAFFVLEESKFGIIGNKLTVSNSSFAARSSELDIFHTYFWNHPLFGVGYQNNGIMKENGLRDATNGVLSLFLQFGLVGAVPISLMYLSGLTSIFSRNADKLLMVLFAFLAFASQPTIFSPIFICMLFGRVK